jgi:hypothetical protein
LDYTVLTSQYVVDLENAAIGGEEGGEEEEKEEGERSDGGLEVRRQASAKHM